MGGDGGVHGIAHGGGRGGDHHPRFFQLFHFMTGCALSLRDHRSSVSHASAGGRAAASDEGGDRLLASMLREKLRGFFFCRAADFAHHEDGIGVVIIKK